MHKNQIGPFKKSYKFQQEDYLKINGMLFFRLLQTLSDEEEEIRHLTTFYIQQRLLKRHPKVMHAHLIEALFHFNEFVVSYFRF